MENPFVSIVIPAYNSKRYIEESIRSVVNQTHQNFELIVVDDGSTDGQSEIILDWCGKDKRIRSVRNPNQGVSAARNTGFNHSCGEYVAFLDADDVWMPENLFIKIKKFTTGNYGLVHSDAWFIDEHSNRKGWVMAGCEGCLLEHILQWKTTQIPGPSSILVKREVLQIVGLFDTRLSTSADHDFFLRVAEKFTIGRVPVVTWKYRLHNANMHKVVLVMERDILRVYAKAKANKLFKTKWFERECYATMYLILAASWAGDGENKTKALYFMCKVFLSHPIVFTNTVKRVMNRWL